MVVLCTTMLFSPWNYYKIPVRRDPVMTVSSCETTTAMLSCDNGRCRFLSKGLPAEERVLSPVETEQGRRAVRNVQYERSGKGGGKGTNRLAPVG
jgi:hypothetical protein